MGNIILIILLLIVFIFFTFIVIKGIAYKKRVNKLLKENEELEKELSDLVNQLIEQNKK